jgi:ATP-dependent Clp protease ATP-binding subunit ClpA
MTRQPGDELSSRGKLSLAVARLFRGGSGELDASRARPPVGSTKPVTTAGEDDADQLERLTDESRHVLDVARNEARTLGQSRVGTEHLLIALTRSTESRACRVMEQLGTTPPRVRADVLDSLTSGTKSLSGPSALTPRARLAIELGHRAAARIGAPMTAPEHLLIGLAAEGEGIAAKALRKSGIVARTAEKQVISDLDGGTTDP